MKHHPSIIRLHIFYNNYKNDEFIKLSLLFLFLPRQSVRCSRGGRGNPEFRNMIVFQFKVQVLQPCFFSFVSIKEKVGGGMTNSKKKCIWYVSMLQDNLVGSSEGFDFCMNSPSIQFASLLSLFLPMNPRAIYKGTIKVIFNQQ